MKQLLFFVLIASIISCSVYATNPFEKDIAQQYPPNFVIEELKRSYHAHCGWGKAFAFVSILGIFAANSHATLAYILLGCASLTMLVDAYRDRVILMALDEQP